MNTFTFNNSITVYFIYYILYIYYTQLVYLNK